MNRIINISKILKNPIKLYSQNNSRFFSEIINSSSSHEDFRPKKKVNDSDIEEINKFIKKLITENKIMLFMKGTPSMPQCGFSYKVSEILKDIGVDFASANILTSPKIAVALKKYSDWPTFPQLYINGEFVGGTDIVTELYEKGELKEIIKKAGIKIDDNNTNK